MRTTKWSASTGEKQAIPARSSLEGSTARHYGPRAEDAAGTFGSSVSRLKPDIVIDMICFDPFAARQLVDALVGRIRHYLCCGTVWVHGYPVTTPITEALPRRPFGDYGIKKAHLEAYLLEEAQVHGFPQLRAARPHRGTGVGAAGPSGNVESGSVREARPGRRIADATPGPGDVASRSRGRCGASIHEGDCQPELLPGRKLPCGLTGGNDDAGLCGVPGRVVRPARAPAICPLGGISRQRLCRRCQQTWDHLAHSSNCSIAKAQKLLDYQPRYSSM